MKKFAPPVLPQVGNTVQWFPHADGQEPPWFAKVVGIHGELLTLLVSSEAGGEEVRKKLVRHVDDPYLDEYPTHARLYGGWKPDPGAVYMTATQHGTDEQILELFKSGVSPSSIAKKIGVAGVNKAYVEKALKNAGCELTNV